MTKKSFSSNVRDDDFKQPCKWTLAMHACREVGMSASRLTNVSNWAKRWVESGAHFKITKTSARSPKTSARSARSVAGAVSKAHDR